MTHEEILKKAIEKAIKNGYVGGEFFINPFHLDQIGSKTMWGQFLFDHDFARAFFGYDLVDGEGWNKKKYMHYIKRCVESGISTERLADPDKVCNEIAWKYHLKEMVLCEDPILYLKNFLD